MSGQREHRSGVMNLANAISAGRIALTPLVAWAVLTGHPSLALSGLALVITSDLLDGLVARRRRQVTPFGRLLDHGADALFVTVLAGVGAHLGLLPTAFAPIIALAFLQYALDSRILRQRTLRPSRLGRINGIAHYVIVAAAIVVQLHLPDVPVARAVVMASGWLLVATSVASIAERGWHLVHAARGS
jgi:phosphatidylglycerophosphate synthase